MVNFNYTVKSIAKGNLTRKVSIRKGDYLREECDNINEMVDSLGRFIANINTSHERLTSVIEEARAQVDDTGAERKVAETLDMAKREALSVKEGLSIFKTGDKASG